MADVVDMADELAAAAEKPADATSELMERLHRQARAYKALQSIPNAAARRSVQVEERLADLLNVAPR